LVREKWPTVEGSTAMAGDIERLLSVLAAKCGDRRP
jgi:hypothetical protein